MKLRRKSLGSRINLIDTVYLVAYFRPSDPLHEVADRVLGSLGEKEVVSQAAMIEFDLLMKSRSLSLEERLKALSLLGVLVDGKLAPLTPADMAAAAYLFDRYKLDYFDSLFAAQCILREAEPLTTDEEILEVVSSEEIRQEILNTILL